MTLEDVDQLAEALAERLSRSDRPLYSPKTLAERLGVSERMVRQLLADEEIPSFTIGGARRIEPEAVDAYIAARRSGSND